MADITLGEAGGTAWLVGGEEWIDDLLAGTLPAEVSIEIVPCESYAEVREMWQQGGGGGAGMTMPWMIHPGIVDRVRGVVPELAVLFGPWSAMLDDAAQAVIRAAVTQVVADEAVLLTLTEFFDPDGPKSISDLFNLRAQLIEERLVELGVERKRLGRGRRHVNEIPDLKQEPQRVDIVVARTAE